MEWPPPHRVYYEALNDRAMAHLWNQTRAEHPETEMSEVDAAKIHSVDEFSAWFDQWITSASGSRFRILLIWHAHCLSSACQQMLRRSLEKRSFRNRVWFHTEEPGALQPAILSRCIVQILVPVPPPVPAIYGTLPEEWIRCWNDPVGYEMELRTSTDKGTCVSLPTRMERVLATDASKPKPRGRVGSQGTPTGVGRGVSKETPKPTTGENSGESSKPTGRSRRRSGKEPGTST